MSRKVKYSIEEKLNAVQNYLDGKESMYSIANRFGIDVSSVSLWVNKYKAMGVDAFSTNQNKHYTKEEKEQAMGLLVRRSGGFSKPNHLYVKIPSDEIGLQPVENKVVEKIAATEPEKQPSSGRKNGCAEARNVAPSKVTEKYKSNKYHEVNYCYVEGESL